MWLSLINVLGHIKTKMNKTNRIPRLRIMAALILMVIIASIPSAAFAIHKPVAQKLQIQLAVLGWDGWAVSTGRLLADELKKIGMQLEVQALDDSVLYPAIDKRDYGMFSMAIGWFQPFPFHIYSRFHSSTDVPGGDNMWSYRNPQVDELLDRMLVTANESEFRTLLYQVQEKLVSDMPYIPLFAAEDVHPFEKGWEGLYMMPAGPLSPFNRLTIINVHHPTKDTFVVAMNRDPETINPLTASTGRSLWYSLFVYDSLIALDSQFRPIPWLAERWERSADGRSLTFYLRTNVSWHDGRPLTADDVAFTFNYIKENKSPYHPDVLKYVESVEVKDSRTVVIHLSEPYIWALESFGRVFIVPKHIWEGKTFDRELDPSKEPIIGSGPYKFDSRVPGEYIKLVKNENFWLKGYPKVNAVILRPIAEESARILAIKKGEVATERYSAEPAFIEEVLKDPNLQVTRVIDQWDYVIAFNLREFPYNVSAVRKAIAYALDRERIVNVAALGFAVPIYSYVAEAFFGSGLENPRARFPAYNLTLANKLLDDAGFRDVDGDGIRELPGAIPPSGLPLYIYFAIGTAIVIVLALALVARKRRARKIPGPTPASAG
jgi:peptide/nickel transport system substrate-binding protein